MILGALLGLVGSDFVGEGVVAGGGEYGVVGVDVVEKEDSGEIIKVGMGRGGFRKADEFRRLEEDAFGVAVDSGVLIKPSSPALGIGKVSGFKGGGETIPSPKSNSSCVSSRCEPNVCTTPFFCCWKSSSSLSAIFKAGLHRSLSHAPLPAQ